MLIPKIIQEKQDILRITGFMCTNSYEYTFSNFDI